MKLALYSRWIGLFIIFMAVVQKFNFLSIMAIFCMSYLILNGNLILPFLDDTVIPTSLLIPKVPKIIKSTNKVDIEMKIDCKDAHSVMFFAANSKDDCEAYENPKEAYGEYENSGIVKVDKNGDCKNYLFIN